jgi:hypothetical protein
MPGGKERYLSRAARVLWHTPQLGGALAYTILALGAAGWIALRRKSPGSSAAFASLAIAALLLHTVLSPHLDSRHYLPAVGPALAMAAVAIARLPRPAAALVTASLLALCGNPALGPKLDTEMTAAADFLSNKGGVWLVSSDSSGEGAFLTAIALRESRPSSYVLRANKMLADQSWMGLNYRPLHASVEEVAAALDRWPVDAVVMDESGRFTLPHHQTLRRALESRREWSVAFRSGKVRVWTRPGRRAVNGEFRRELSERLRVAWR